MNHKFFFEKTYKINDELTLYFYMYDLNSFFKYKLYTNGKFIGKGIVNTQDIFNIIKSELCK